jgi:Immunoglobulin-like domain of bacterial spore germination
MNRLALLVAVALATACSPSAPKSDGMHIVREAMVSVSVSPQDRVKSPLSLKGVAPNNWFFEAVFPVQLLDANGIVIAEAPAQAQTDWTTEGPVPFVADLSFAVSGDTPATLVLAEDMPSGLPGQREVRIPVTLTE